MLHNPFMNILRENMRRIFLGAIIGVMPRVEYFVETKLTRGMM